MDKEILRKILKDVFFKYTEEEVERLNEILEFRNNKGITGWDIFQHLNDLYDLEHIEDDKIKMTILSNLEDWYVRNNIQNTENYRFLFKTIELKDDLHRYIELYKFLDKENERHNNILVDDTVLFINKLINEIIKNGSNKDITMDDLRNMVWISLVKLEFNEEMFFSNIKYFLRVKNGVSGIRFFNSMIFNFIHFSKKRVIDEKPIYRKVHKMLIDWCEWYDMDVIRIDNLLFETVKEIIKYNRDIYNIYDEIILKQITQMSKNTNNDLMSSIVVDDNFVFIYKPLLRKIDLKLQQ